MSQTSIGLSPREGPRQMKSEVERRVYEVVCMALAEVASQNERVVPRDSSLTNSVGENESLLTFSALIGENTPHNDTKCQAK